MSQLKLVARIELADVDRLQLQFSEIMPDGEYSSQSISLSGYFDRAYAETLTVGNIYEISLTEVI